MKVDRSLINIKSRILKYRIMLGLVVLLFFTPQFAQAQISEMSLKAVFIERITRFVEWPEITFEPNQDTFELVVLGQHDFDKLLDQIYSKYKIKSCSVNIRYVDDISEIGNPHLIFIGKINNIKLNQLLSITENKPILLISDYKKYKDKSLMFVYYSKGETLSIDISLKAIKQSGLKVSHLLLNSANIYEK